MQKRRNILGVVVSVGVVMTMASGCAAPTTEESESDMGEVSQGVNTGANCSASHDLKESQKRATKALKYIMGANGVGECGDFKVYADVVRNAIKDGKLNITSTTKTYICDRPTKRITTTQAALTSKPNEGPLWAAIHELGRPGGKSDTCFGNGTSTFLMLKTDFRKEGSGYRNWAEWDPEPAVLSGDLTGGTGTGATASWTTGGATVAYKIPALGGSCGGATGGQPCSPYTEYAGKELLKTVVQKGSTCYCR